MPKKNRFTVIAELAAKILAEAEIAKEEIDSACVASDDLPKCVTDGPLFQSLANTVGGEVVQTLLTTVFSAYCELDRLRAAYVCGLESRSAPPDRALIRVMYDQLNGSEELYRRLIDDTQVAATSSIRKSTRKIGGR